MTLEQAYEFYYKIGIGLILHNGVLYMENHIDKF